MKMSAQFYRPLHIPASKQGLIKVDFSRSEGWTATHDAFRWWRWCVPISVAWSSCERSWTCVIIPQWMSWKKCGIAALVWDSFIVWPTSKCLGCFFSLAVRLRVFCDTGGSQNNLWNNTMTRAPDLASSLFKVPSFRAGLGSVTYRHITNTCYYSAKNKK